MAPPDGTSESETNGVARPQQKMEQLKALRTTTKNSMLRIQKLIAKKGVTLATAELNCRLDMLEELFKKIKTVQDGIDQMCVDEEAEANEMFTIETEDLYVATKTKIMGLLSKRRPVVDDVSVLNTTAAGTVARPRREVKLPKFEGKYSDFPNFISLFTKLIHQDESFDNCERFLILKEHLGSKPLSAIDDFDVTEENYSKALARLKECFDKKALMFEEHISALFSLSKSSKTSSAHLRYVINSVNAHLSAMLSLGDYTAIANAMVIHIAMECVDADTQVKWEENVDYNKLSTWEECSSILTRRCENLEARESKLKQDDKKQTNSHKVHGGKRYNPTTLAVTKSSCVQCGGNGHSLPQCYRFKALTIQERSNVIKKSNLCYKCLKKGHSSRDCTASNCGRCNSPHHPLLHKDAPEVSASNTSEYAPSTSTQATAITQIEPRNAVLNLVAKPEVLLATAVVLVRDNCGKYHRARAVLDAGAQVNLMCENLAQKLLLKKKVCNIEASLAGEVPTCFKRETITSIKSCFNEFEASLEFYVLPKITSNKPSAFYDIASWNIPKNIQLADPMFNKPSRVDLLIGAEIFFDMLCVGRIHLRDDLPRLHKTLLGWIVAGKSKENVTSLPKIGNVSVNKVQMDTDYVNTLVEKFWQMEQIPNNTVFLTEEELQCEQIFNENIKRDNNGRFITKIPFKSSVSELGSSYSAAERRFVSLEQKLINDDETKRAYNQFMEEYLALGHMSRVEESERNKIKYYAPHQIVLRPDSTSTKLRVVFDCSCKTDSGWSLNEVMMKGPRVQDDLLSIILRFRCYKFALTADVTKMYRQAWVTEEDSYYQAILWRAAPNEKIQVYKLQTITYGTTAAPYLATKCLQKLGEDCRNQFPLASTKILSDFYMDDFISGANDENELVEIYRQVAAVMESAKFTLRKWFSNSKVFNKFVPDADREKTIRLNDEEIIKTLGIVWAPLSDSFHYVWPKLDSSRGITKRIVLAELSTLFDPLGLINPIIVKAKIFMQDLWILKVDWDESLPVNLHTQWADFRERLKEVEKVKIPRSVVAKSKVVRIEMHGFSDASKRAYGCCIYIRSISEDNVVSVHLWTAKSKVSPLKTQSLPRLELLGAELLTKLVIKSKHNFPVDLDATYLWTDSEIVLAWLSEHPSQWNVFVANRVSFIQEETKSCVWGHVPTKDNPADIISRGAYGDEIINSIWFTGPQFLKKTLWRVASK
ncbi:uncharacterized protein LOC142224854 [Haematobia irritans]|uniref:uncharacterized protein LOC142224854 n=1 Tax=Haematobia irritans TaxID=7368 RepID=UPI003F501F80